MSDKQVFITGASGFIGGSVAAALAAKGYRVQGLTRSRQKAEQLKSSGIDPLVGELTDAALLAEAARRADIVINAASSDSQEAVAAMLPALSGTGKTYIQNSGSSIVCERGTGDVLERIFDETTELSPAPEKERRVALDRKVLSAAEDGVGCMVVCPCLIYGEGLGLQKESAQIPHLIRHALKTGVATRIGRGENVWSTIHIRDLVKLYLLLVESPAAPGTFMFAENGEIDFRSIVDRIHHALKLSEPVASWTPEQAAEEWGVDLALFALASNSRVRAKKARQLGWSPELDCVLEDIERSCKSLQQTSATVS